MSKPWLQAGRGVRINFPRTSREIRERFERGKASAIKAKNRAFMSRMQYEDEVMNLSDARHEGATMCEKLQIGDQFPTLTLPLVRGGSLQMPVDISSRYAVFLFYRGHW